MAFDHTHEASPETRKFYRKVSQPKFNDFRERTGLSWKQMPDIFVQDLIERRYIWAPRTWNVYKAAISGRLLDEGFLEEAELLRETPPDTKRYKEFMAGNLRNSQKKLKKFDKDRRDMVTYELLHGKRKKPSKYAEATVDWFEAATDTGLRPVEWKMAKVIYTKAGEPRLVVKTAKKRGDFVLRGFGLENFSAEQIERIERHIKTVKENCKTEKEWKKFYNGCRDVLLDAVKRLWPNEKKRPSLYSARHQCIANMKAVKLTPQDVAQFSGHVSTRTANTCYGRKRDGDASAAKIVVDQNAAKRIKVNHTSRPDMKNPLKTMKGPGVKPELDRNDGAEKRPTMSG